MKKSPILLIVICLLAVISVNVISSFYHWRFDLTSEKRYTLSSSTKDMLKSLDDYVYFKVFLTGDDLPAGFQRLRNETREMLDEFSAHSKYVEFDFIDPAESQDAELTQRTYAELYDLGLQPTELRIKTKDGAEQKIIFPGAIATYKEKEIAIQLLQNQVGVPNDEVLNNSIQSLEYQLSNAIRKITSDSKANVAILEDYGTMPPSLTVSFENMLKEYYNVERITLGGHLNSLADISDKGGDTVKMSNKYNVLVVAGPTVPFSEKDKFIIDQFVMRGGNILWLVEPLAVTMDSLQNKPDTYAVENNTNTVDMLFNYGVRLENQLVVDAQCLSIPMTVGNVGDKPQIDFFKWHFFPVLIPTSTHPIVKNLNAIKTEFVSPITAIEVDGISSTTLLSTSSYSNILPSPVLVSLRALNENINVGDYKYKNIPVAVLLEGKFTSLYDNRIPAELIDNTLMDFQAQGKPAKMIVVSDADIIKNQFRAGDGIPLPVGYDQYTDIQFGNRELLMNMMNYLCGDDDLISVRSRELKLRTLDMEKVKNHATMTKVMNVALPPLMIICAGLLFNVIRKRKYTKK